MITAYPRTTQAAASITHPGYQPSEIYLSVSPDSGRLNIATRQPEPRKTSAVESTTRFRYPPKPTASTFQYSTQPYKTGGYPNVTSSFLTASIRPSLSLSGSSPKALPTANGSAQESKMAAQNAFLPVSKDRIPSNIPQRGDHPVRRNNIVSIARSIEFVACRTKKFR